MPVALITGASRGFGNALAKTLAQRGWTLIIDGRDPVALSDATRELAGAAAVTAIDGDVADPAHRDRLARAISAAGRLDLLINNASDLGATPLPPLARYPIDELERVFRVNAIAPLAIIQAVLPEVRAAAGGVVDISSDAAVEAYPGWGGYGASKAALDRLTAVIAAEEPGLRFYAFDPGDMRTVMHQAAYPGEDISDRALPETVVPALLRLIEERPPSGRYRASDLLVAAGTPA
jgi:NAD(P)-dependent dehydrogenase (short-subunit alcohol dehydrogenase family)